MGMNISDFFDMDVLIQILTDWSTATGIGIIAVDEKGEYMMRSEERRVGKECRSRWSPYH